MTDADAGTVKLAAETFLYGYPLVYGLDETNNLIGGTGVLPVAAQWNAFSCARSLGDPSVHFVSLNNDTLYLMAPCDLSAGPLLLDVPDTSDRYYVLQFIDAWTNNFAYVGRRSTGTGEGRFLLAPKDYEGPVPAGVQLIEAPSRVFLIGGRVQVDGVADLPAVHALQDRFRVTALDGTSPSAGDGVPAVAPGVGDDLLWWEKLRVALAAFPPPAADAAFISQAEQLGLSASTSPYVTPDPALAAALVAGKRQGEQTLEQLTKTTLEMRNGWSSAFHAFDYNVDYLGPGTIDTPEWKIADRTKAYLTRSVAARLGLWGNHGYEARYDLLWQDEHGDPLDGAHDYELTLSPPPPVKAFWSITMYDATDYYLVANPIDRYSIGDRTEGLRYNDDGSVTIHMQKNSPGPERESNWLPTPAGPFRPVARAYQPTGTLLSGDYTYPAVRRTDDAHKAEEPGA